MKHGHSDVQKRLYTNSDTSLQDSHVGEVVEFSRRQSVETDYKSRQTVHVNDTHTQAYQGVFPRAKAAGQ